MEEILKLCCSLTLFRIFVIIYSVCIVLLLILNIWKFCRTILSNTKVIEELGLAITEGNTVKSIEILEKYPTIVNVADYELGYTPFLMACFFGNTPLITYMLKKGANIKLTTKTGESAFYLASYNRIRNSTSTDATCLHTLYYAGADIDLPNQHGYSPIQIAAVFGHTNLIKWLLRKGCNTMVNPSPYALALSQGYLQAARVLRAYEEARIDQ